MIPVNPFDNSQALSALEKPSALLLKIVVVFPFVSPI